MKKGIIFYGAILITMGINGCFNYNKESEEGRKENFKAQLGTYVLDTHKTDLGVYSKDSNEYKKLTIIFKADSTFSMNMKVPFMYDSSGSWVAGDMTEWNYMRFKGFNYGESDKYSGSQFTRPYMSNSNLYFLINACTPQAGDGIQVIYFRKLNSNDNAR